jgi:hypothetical protein
MTVYLSVEGYEILNSDFSSDVYVMGDPKLSVFGIKSKKTQYSFHR